MHRLSGIRAATLFVLSPLVAAAQQGAVDRRPTVAVIQFNNSSLVRHDEYEPLSKGMADLLGSTMRANTAIRVVERDALQAVLKEQSLTQEKRVDDATAAKVGQLLGARYLIKGTFFIEPKGRVRIVAQAINSTTGQLEFGESANGTTDDLLAIIDALALKFNQGLKLGELALPSRGVDTPAPSGSRWAALMTYSRALDAEDKGDKKSALALYSDFIKSPVSASYVANQRTYALERVRMLGGGGS